jgi:DEAD/DEAH box helicase domain-containing protein
VLEQALDALRTDRVHDEASAHDHLARGEATDSGFVAWREIPAAPARYAGWPAAIDNRLVVALAARGIDRPYTHQAHAVETVLAGQHAVVVTPTASGKTLCYNLAVLQAILDDPDARALYLFPTKALAQDQMQELHALITQLGNGAQAPSPARSSGVVGSNIRTSGQPRS